MEQIQPVRIGNCHLYHGDCLDVLPLLDRVNLILGDPPYGTTQCGWDVVIPFQQMWAAFELVTQPETAILLFGSEPFSSFLRTSNIERFKYDWVWDKMKGTGFLNAKKQPLRYHEVVSVFYERQCAYFPQKTTGHQRKTTFRGSHHQTDVYGQMANDYRYDSTERYPKSIQCFSTDTQNSSLHPTQKPVGLLEYLLRTYSRSDDIVLDPFMGSASTGIACLKTGRKFIGIEREPEYFEIACERIRAAHNQTDLFVDIPQLSIEEARS